MKLYAIRRYGNWKDGQELESAASRSARVGNEEMPHRVRWIRSYVVREEDGRFGTFCIYQGADAAAIREHARRSGMQADEVVEIEQTVIVRDDPTEKDEAA